jgi:Holliday junction resolvasome RuvABC endonuclease subunit
MKEKGIAEIIRTIFVGRRYSRLKNINEQVRYLIMDYAFMVAAIPRLFWALPSESGLTFKFTIPIPA